MVERYGEEYQKSAGRAFVVRQEEGEYVSYEDYVAIVDTHTHERNQWFFEIENVARCLENGMTIGAVAQELRLIAAKVRPTPGKGES